MWMDLGKRPTSRTKWFFGTSISSLRTWDKKNSDVKFFSNWYLQLFAYTHTKFERLEALLQSRARCLKADTSNFFVMLKFNKTGIGGAKNNRQKSGRKFINYNSTYAYLSLSSHSMPSKQLLNVSTWSVLTPKQRELNYTRVGQAPAKNGWHFKSRKRSTSSKLRRTENTGSDISINVFTNFSSQW